MNASIVVCRHGETYAGVIMMRKTLWFCLFQSGRLAETHPHTAPADGNRWPEPDFLQAPMLKRRRMTCRPKSRWVCLLGSYTG